ncbi:hypothetical protein J7M22_05435 [Candidatus Poribacteria bacterium]|nr:hypothetical protein [Candidatus Poribacteria bacterium]
MSNLQQLIEEKKKLEKRLAAALAENRRALKINKELREENIRLKILLRKRRKRAKRRP